jgi:hypothetical protein
MPKPKYSNYAELAAAFKSGELSKHYYLMLDKGGTENSLNYFDPNASDEENEKMQNGCAELFGGDHDIETVFDALGIPWLWR